MHICIDARMWHASGIGTYLQNLLPPLSHQYNLTLIGDEKQLATCHAKIIHNTIPIYSIPDLLRFPRLVPSCDLFWSPHYNIPLLPIPARKRLVTIHDVFHLAFLQQLSFKQKIYATSVLKAAVRLSDSIVTVSDFSKAEIIRYTRADPEKIHMIYNGVNHERFQPVRQQALLQKVKLQYQLPDKYLLFVGNVKPHKNLMSLVKAFAQIKEQLPGYSLVVVGKKEGFITGDDTLFNMLQQDDSLSRRVTFTGFVAEEDLPALYTMADLFIFPSLYEGFGLPPLEAMACGCPTLVSERASMPEICGEVVWYINPEDVNHIGQQIIRAVSLLPNERQTWIENGIKKAQLFTWEKAISQHISIISELI